MLHPPGVASAAGPHRRRGGQKGGRAHPGRGRGERKPPNRHWAGASRRRSHRRMASPATLTRIARKKKLVEEPPLGALAAYPPRDPPGTFGFGPSVRRGVATSGGPAFG